MAKKRFIIYILLISFFTSGIHVQDAAAKFAFSDIEGEYAWAEEAIEYLAEKGIVSGVGENVFAPANKLTREEVSTIIARAQNLGTDGKTSDFEDVANDRWSYPYVSAVYDAGLMTGISDKIFGAKNPITRAEYAVIMQKLIGRSRQKPETKDMGDIYTDDADIPDWAADAAYELKRAGIMTGEEDNMFLPDKAVNRAEACGILYNVLQAVGNDSEPTEEVTAAARDAKYSEAMLTMQTFGIINANVKPDATFEVDDMSEMIYKYLRIGTDMTEPEATRRIYNDVDRWHWAAGYIEYLYNNDIYAGDGTGNYEPDRNARLSDVCGIMINLLGYANVAKRAGEEWDAISKARDLKLIGSGENGIDHDITYAELASICYKTLFTNAVAAAIGGSNIKIEQKDEFITEYFGLKYGTGIMTGADMHSLTHTECRDGYAVIDGTAFYEEGISRLSCLGMKVKYYYDESTGQLVLKAAVPIKNDELYLKAEQIQSYNNNTYRYSDDNRVRSAHIDNNMKLLYNGKITSQRNPFVPKYGTVRLIDNTGDGKYDVVIIENAYNVLFESLNNEIIYGQNLDESGKKHKINIKDADYLSIERDGINISPSDIKENSIITAVVSEDEKLFKLYVSDRTTDGTIMAADEEEIDIDGNVYKVADKLYNPDLAAVPGKKVTVYFDVYGNAAAVLAAGDGEYHYGYVLKVSPDEDEDNVIVKLLGDDGKEHKYSCDSKVVIDNTRAVSINAVSAFVNVGELIRYKLRNECLWIIDTAENKGVFDNYTYYEDSDSLRVIACDYLIYKSGASLFKKIYETGAVVEGEVGIADDTPVFFVPEDDTDAESSDYYVTTRTAIPVDSLEKVKIYASGKKTMVADALIYYYKRELDSSAGIFVVDKIIRKVNEDNAQIYGITGYMNGEKAEYDVEDGSILTANGRIARGSVIRLSTKRNGIVDSIQNLYSADGTGELNNAEHEYKTGYSAVPCNYSFRVVLGSCVEKEGTYMRFKFKDNVSKNELFNLSGCRVYVYDKSEDTVSVGNALDIYDYETYGSAYDELIVCTRAAITSDIIIVKE